MYTEALDYAFSNDDIRNIAITGVYGAGKSTVWNTYKDIKLKERNFNLFRINLFKNVITVNSGDITQQDLVEQMMFPKQTIHSSVKKLSADQYVRVTPLPSSRKSKKLSLTEKGKTYIEMTVAKMVEAEKEAIRAMGQEDMQKYVELQGKYLTLVKNEFTKAELLTLTDDMENN